LVGGAGRHQRGEQAHAVRERRGTKKRTSPGRKKKSVDFIRSKLRIATRRRPEFLFHEKKKTPETAASQEGKENRESSFRGLQTRPGLRQSSKKAENRAAESLGKAKIDTPAGRSAAGGGFVEIGKSVWGILAGEKVVGEETARPPA